MVPPGIKSRQTVAEYRERAWEDPGKVAGQLTKDFPHSDENFDIFIKVYSKGFKAGKWYRMVCLHVRLFRWLWILCIEGTGGICVW